MTAKMSVTQKTIATDYLNDLSGRNREGWRGRPLSEYWEVVSDCNDIQDDANAMGESLLASRAQHAAITALFYCADIHGRPASNCCWCDNLATGRPVKYAGVEHPACPEHSAEYGLADWGSCDEDKGCDDFDGCEGCGASCPCDERPRNRSQL